jgi:ABC-2 type transport system ATP-binding protein
MDEAELCDQVAFMHMGELLIYAQSQDIPKRFSQVLLELKCDHSMRILQALNSQSSIDWAQIYGDNIHIAGKEINILQSIVEKVLKQEKILNFALNRISPCIEDVFVDLMKFREDQ